MIYLGTSGYSYEDWVGRFYPTGLPSRDFLTFYARHFPTVEINYTYYSPPTVRALQAMARKAGPQMLFALKATSAMTHEREATPEVFTQFREALAPLQATRQLACVLAQFPHSFHNTEPNRAYLAHLGEQLSDLPVVVEFRSVEWAEPEVYELLRRLSLGFCCVDQPRFRTLVPPVAIATSEWGYLRFHGRNYEHWWQHEQAWQRYDYLYSAEELAEWVPKVRELAAETRHVLVYFNNHYQAQAAQNAQLFTDLLAQAGLEVARAAAPGGQLPL
ncbi:MAG TPA: DUF72 domain-containing protein [Armatimonadota bacterium]|jgi:uncharacterized protein YecE (DUF72 family)